MEQWMDIKGYEGFYQVSTLGNIKRLDIEMTQKGNGGSEFTYMRKGGLIKGSVGKKGYRLIVLNTQTNRGTYTIHRLVAQHFIPNPDDLPQVNHIDGNKLNNTVTNLEWVTNQQNRDHAMKNGLHRVTFGEERENAILDDDKVRDIKLNFEKGRGKKNSNYFAKKYGVHKQTILNIMNGKKWKHIQV